MRTHWTVGAAVLVTLAGLSLMSLGQVVPRDPAPATSDAASETDRRASLRERLEQRLEETRERIARYQRHEKGILEAIKRLDAGESPDAVMGEMRERARDEIRNSRERLARDRVGGGTGDRPHPGAIDPASRDRVFQALKARAPRAFERVQSLREQSPEQSDRLLMRLAPRIRQIEEVQREDPELATLMIVELQANLELTVAARDLRALMQRDDVSDEQIAKAREHLREAMRRSFDAHLAIKEHELRRLEERIGSLRREIDRRQSMRDDYIDRQVQRILSPEGGAVDLPRPGPRG